LFLQIVFLAHYYYSGKEFESQEVPPQLSGKQWNDQTMNKNKIQKNIREMDRIINLFNSQRGSTHLATSLDRILGETRKVAVRVRENSELKKLSKFSES